MPSGGVHPITQGGTLITIDAQHTLTLGGLAPATLTAANFRFV